MAWQLLPYNCPINPVHAAVLRTGKVFFFTGSGNDPNNVANSPQGSAVWDVSNGTFSRPEIPLEKDGSVIDVFCAGQSFRPNGRLFIAGGTKQYDPFFGQTAAFVFDPPTERWIRVASMNQGRWYPTVLTLGNGRIFALSGSTENGGLSVTPEVFAGGSVGWDIFSQPTSPFSLYAHLFLLSTGKLFYTGAQLGGNNNVSPRILTLPPSFSSAIAEQAVSGLQQADFGNQAASVLLPPAQDQKVMIIGGGDGNGMATNRVNIIDLKAATPTYTAASPLNRARMHHNAVLLPDRTVFVCNGSGMNEDIAQSTVPGEIYNPATNTWTVVETPAVNGRVYHSVALLLPDGRVITAGGNPNRGSYEARLEIYSPAYVTQPRPVIQSVPQFANYNKTFVIQTPQAANIKWAHLINPMATTHGLDTSQRLVDLPIVSRNATSLSVGVTSNRNLAHPGFYMLFIVNNNNVPSVGTWIQIR
jgi:Domain of unknown function (DUF1929)